MILVVIILQMVLNVSLLCNQQLFLLLISVIVHYEILLPWYKKNPDFAADIELAKNKKWYEKTYNTVMAVAWCFLLYYNLWWWALTHFIITVIIGFAQGVYQSIVKT